jgi:hypothetical protein
VKRAERSMGLEKNRYFSEVNWANLREVLIEVNVAVARINISHDFDV